MNGELKSEKAGIAIIVGAGPAGLTAALELLRKSEIRPVIIEEDIQVGGISKTVNYKGNRMDLGGHRFFTKSDRVMEWWLSIMKVQDDAENGLAENGLAEKRYADKRLSDKVFLVRNRLSRIFFLRKFFDYPISISVRTMRNLGFVRLVKSGFSYIFSRMFPRKEVSLEDFYINRFGKELYKTFFKDYTTKVWGTDPSGISPEWGAQRVKGLSVTGAVLHALRSSFCKKRNDAGDSPDILQKGVETSLIERFLYPKFGPGQLWEAVADEIIRLGGEVITGAKVTGMFVKDNRTEGVVYIDSEGNEHSLKGDYFFSTMAVRDLVNSMDCNVPEEIKRISNGLVYRDFMTAGILVSKMKTGLSGMVPDTWIYIQEKDVDIGRLQIFNNWSPFMVKDPGTVWLGLEYFVNEGDRLWAMADDEFISMATEELEKIKLIDSKDLISATVVRVKKAYPAYFGTYSEFGMVREFLDGIDNLYLIGRNGQHRYNNQDHSMLTAITAVENLLAGVRDKSNIWGVNTEETYHESGKLKVES